MSVDTRKIFKKCLLTEIRDLGFSEDEAKEVIKNCKNEMIDEAIANFKKPKDFAFEITQ